MSLKVIVNGQTVYEFEGPLASANAVFYHDDGREIARKGTDCETLARVELDVTAPAEAEPTAAASPDKPKPGRRKKKGDATQDGAPG